MFWRKRQQNLSRGVKDFNNTPESLQKLSRRDMLKLGTLGTAIGAVTAVGMSKQAASEALDKKGTKLLIKPQKDFPVKIDPSYKRFHQKNTVFSQAVSGIHKTLGPLGRTFERFETDEKRPGFTRIDWALHHGSWAVEHAATAGSKFGVPNQGWFSWEQKTKKTRESFLDLNYVYDEQHKFQSKQEAADVIKRAARHFGADIVGITSRNEMWDYDKFFIAPIRQEIGWDKFPFKPKSVIVIGLEMDYESIATAPSYTLEGAIGQGYSQMAITAYQVSVFLKCLGYKAVACGNDLGLSVPYAVQAGLGETGRFGMLINYKYGPRLRLCKVYTDFDFVEYDKPVTFGVKDFCERCKRCADACPSKSISQDDTPSMAPTYKGPEKWFSNPGVEKWYVNAKTCFEYWCEGNNSCAACISACPYNKPDFWHHRLVDKITKLMPGPVHSLMREMDIIFGYGNTFDKKAVKRFWSRKSREYNGF